MSGKFFAEPEAVFGHHDPGFEVFLIAEIPWVYSPGEADCGMMSHPKLQSEVGIGDRPAEQVGLDAYVLCEGTRRE